jgi:hypothetical protein
MEESRTKRLQELLKRLGQAVHGSVVQSQEVRLPRGAARGRVAGRDADPVVAGLRIRRTGGQKDIHIIDRQCGTACRIDAEDARL